MSLGRVSRSVPKRKAFFSAVQALRSAIRRHCAPAALASTCRGLPGTVHAVFHGLEPVPDRAKAPGKPCQAEGERDRKHAKPGLYVQQHDNHAQCGGSGAEKGQDFPGAVGTTARP